MTLTRNPNTTCPGEDTVFTCTVTNSRTVRWLAEPYIFSFSGVIIKSGSAFNARFFDGPNDAIMTVRESVDPFITSMTISGNLIDVLNITCQSLDSDNDTPIEERSEIYQLASMYHICA